MRGGLFLFLFIPAHRSMTFRSSPACSLMFRPAFQAHLRGWAVYRCKCTYSKYEKCTCNQQNCVVAWTRCHTCKPRVAKDLSKVRPGAFGKTFLS